MQKAGGRTIWHPTSRLQLLSYSFLHQASRIKLLFQERQFLHEPVRFAGDTDRLHLQYVDTGR